jgi:hypothetical protein
MKKLKFLEYRLASIESFMASDGQFTNSSEFMAKVK